MNSVFASIVIIVSLFLNAAISSEKSQMMSYKEWKSLKIEQAQKKLAKTLKKSSFTKRTAESNQLNRELRSNLEIAKQLSAADYFNLYLSPQLSEGKKADAKALKSLTPAQIAEILSSYAAQLKLQTDDREFKPRSALQLAE